MPQEKPDRAFRWRAFAYVHDWRLLNRKEGRAATRHSVKQDEIESALHQLGDRFLTKKGKKARSSGRKLPQDPYQKDWREGFNLREFCEERGVGRLYTEAYDPFSDWHHWGVGGLGAAVQRVDGRIRYHRESLNNCAVSLSAAFQCLLQTTQIADKCFQLGIEGQLMELRDGFLEYHRTAPQEPSDRNS